MTNLAVGHTKPRGFRGAKCGGSGGNRTPITGFGDQRSAIKLQTPNRAERGKYQTQNHNNQIISWFLCGVYACGNACNTSATQSFL